MSSSVRRGGGDGVNSRDSQLERPYETTVGPSSSRAGPINHDLSSPVSCFDFQVKGGDVNVVCRVLTSRL